ncbi:conserved hypothetical protein [Oenococcus oeni]|nr:conserved hypothetical protein [Oenococcus oeni]
MSNEDFNKLINTVTKDVSVDTDISEKKVSYSHTEPRPTTY